jgi:predicted metal-dependent hydrolase
VTHQQHVQLASEEKVDPNEQDRRHGLSVAPSPTAGSVGPVEHGAFERGLELVRTGRYFEAHEDLEVAWRAAEPAEKDFLQGLVHVAVAWYQAGRGNEYGCSRQLEKAARRLGGYAPHHRGVDVAAILAQLRDATALVEAGSLQLPPPQI